MIVQITRDPTDAQRLVASFPYDPVVIAAIKSVPGRTWDKRRKVWSIPDTPENVLALWRALPRGAELGLPPTLREQLRAQQDGIAEAQTIRDRGDHDVDDYEFVTQPYAHQRAGFGFLQKIGSGALLWEMGLGKTKTAIDYCEWLAAKDPPTEVLVITPNSVTGNWLAEVEKHTGRIGLAHVPVGTLVQRATQLGQTRYTIVNTEALSRNPLATAIVKHPWDVVIVDESTRFKNPRAGRTKSLHRMKPPIRLILTGTPITQSPEDAWAQYEFVAPGLLGSWWHFTDKYLQKDFFGNVTGLKPGTGPELAQRLESRSYRILKADVLDLPPKVYVDRHVNLTGDQQRAYDQMKHDLIVQIEEAPHVTASTILVQLLRLTQITAGLVGHGDEYTWLPDNAKVTELDHLLNEELAGEQVVVFGLYKAELEALAQRYVKRDVLRDRVPIIYGPTPPDVRTALIDEFQKGRRRLLFIQTHTGGIGINLTAAKTAIYYTRGWSLEDYLQSQDRLHRIGQTGTVTVLHLVADGSVDEDIAKALSQKQELADQLTGDAARRLAADVLGAK